MKNLFIFLALICMSCSNSGGDTNSGNGDSFINYYKENIDFSDCYLYFSDGYSSHSNNAIERVLELHELITSKGTKLITPLEVIEYKGHSKDIAFKYKDIQNISSVFNELFDTYLDKANDLSEASNLTLMEETYYSNGKLKSIFKNKVEIPFIDCNKNYNENGSLLSFNYGHQNNFQISFEMTQTGEYKNKKLTIFDEKSGLMLFGFEEAYMETDDFDVIANYWLGTEHTALISSKIKNNELIALNHSISSWCPDGKELENGSVKMVAIKLISYDYNEGITEYWENGKKINAVDRKSKSVADLINNIYTAVEYMNNGKDTSSCEISRLTFRNSNGQGILYGEIPNFEGLIQQKTTYWENNTEGNRYKSAETFYDEKGNETEKVYYFPNGEIERREKSN